MAGLLADGRWPVLLLVLLAAVGAGAINTLVGSGTLLTFPVLLAVGLPPVSANITNNVGLVVGSITGTWGYRRELTGQWRRLARLAGFSAAGGLLGALLLLQLPGEVFAAVVPALVALAVVLVLVGPRLNAWAEKRAEADRAPSRAAGVALAGGVFGAGVYGGYFGAAQGVLLIGVLDLGLTETLQRINALKNALATIVNGLATVVFVVAAPSQVSWSLVAILAPGALLGGVLGARFGRRLPAVVLRGIIVVVGIVAIAILISR